MTPDHPESPGLYSRMPGIFHAHRELFPIRTTGSGAVPMEGEKGENVKKWLEAAI
jgi:hypothetical protein